MLSYDFFEIDLLWEILNFKIVSIEKVRIEIEKQYLELEKDELKQKRKISYIYEKMNYLLGIYKYPNIVKDKKYFYYMYENNFEIEDLFIFKNSMREKMIELILFLSDRQLNVRKFLKRINKNEENKRHIKNDLKNVLKKYEINYFEYRNKVFVKEFLKDKINEYESKKIEFLREIFLSKWEKVYFGYGIRAEEILFEIIKEYLDIKNLKKIYYEFKNFILKYKKINSKKLEYNFFLLIILNLKKDKINLNKKINRNSKNIFESEDFKILNEFLIKIEEYEKIIIHKYFKLKLYKYLLRENRKNSKYDDVYKVCENEYKISEKIEKYTLYDNEYEKTKTLVIIDLEKADFMNILKYIQYILDKIEILKIINVLEYKNIVETDFEQILFISNINLKNIIKNDKNIPIYFLSVQTDMKSNAILKRKLIKECEYLYDMMISYKKMKKNSI